MQYSKLIKAKPGLYAILIVIGTPLYILASLDLLSATPASAVAAQLATLISEPPAIFGPPPPYQLRQTIAAAVVSDASSKPPFTFTNPDTMTSYPASTLGETSLASSNYSLYLDPEAQSRSAPASWWDTRPQDAALLQQLATVPSAIWFGDWNAQVDHDARARLSGMQPGQIAVIVAYNIPQRDCGSYSAGGADSDKSYQSWIRKLSQGIGQHPVMLILEPDALANLDCLSTADQDRRYRLLRDAVAVFARQTNVLVYLDAGNAAWYDVDTMAQRLQKANLNQTQGFALNVSNFLTTETEISYGQQLSAAVGGRHFIIDTSRNGLGPAPGYEWCNPPGRAVGTRPTLTTGHARVDAFLWIKIPGESDGECNGGPAAGEWWPEYALGLVKRGQL